MIRVSVKKTLCSCSGELEAVVRQHFVGPDSDGRSEREYDYEERLDFDIGGLLDIKNYSKVQRVVCKKCGLCWDFIEDEIDGNLSI